MKPYDMHLLEKKKTIQREQTLIQEIENMEKDFDSTNLKHLELKTELENIRKDKLNGNMIRSCARWLSEGENLQSISVH